MNVSKTRTYIFFGVLIVLCCLVFFGGFNIGGRRSNIEITETQLVIDNLGTTVTGLNETIRFAGIENKKLRTIQEQDRETIGKLEQTNNELENTNKEIANLLDEQGQIIKELTGINREIRDSGSTIGDGLGCAIEEINSIIADIQARKN